VLEKEKGQIIGGNMYGKTTDELVEQFALSAHLNPQLKDPCYHLMLSLPKTDRAMNDNEITQLSERHLANVVVLSRLTGDESQVKQPDKRIDDAKLNQLADEFIANQLPAYDFFIARHSDKKHDHTHIVASRVNNLDGKSIRTWNNFAHSEHSARVLEREFNLTQVQSSWESKRKAMTRNQRDLVDKLGLPSEEIMRRAIDTVAADKPTMPQLIERLWSEHQVKSIVSYYSHGGVRGIKFGIDIGSVNKDNSPRMLWKQGGNLNKYKCSFNKLQSELGVSYDPKRDDSEIKALTEMLETVPLRQDKQQVIISSEANILTDDLPTFKANTDAAVKNKRQLTAQQSAELYHHYGTGLQNLLVIDQDKKIAIRGLQEKRTEQEVTEILMTSSIGWTQDEASQLVLVAKELMKGEQKEPKSLPKEKPHFAQGDKYLTPSVLDERLGAISIDSAEHQAQQKLAFELVNYAVPIAKALMKHWGEQYGEHSEIKFKVSQLRKEGNQFIYNSDERGEIFRVEVKKKQHQHGYEYSILNIGEVLTTDFEHWDKVSNLLKKLQYQVEAEKVSQSQRRGLSR